MVMTARQVAWKRQKANTQDSQLKRAARRINTRVHRVYGAAYEKVRRLPRRGRAGDAQAEAEINMAVTARQVAWKRQKADAQDSQLKGAPRRENTRVHRVYDAAYEKFLEFAPARSEGALQRLKSLNIDDTRKVGSQYRYIRDKEGRMLRNPGLVLGRWASFFGTLLNAKSGRLRLDIIEGLPQWPVTHALGVELTENELIGALRSMANAKAVGSDELPIELLKLGINHDLTVLREFHRLIKLMPTNGKYRSGGEMP